MKPETRFWLGLGLLVCVLGTIIYGVNRRLRPQESTLVPSAMLTLTVTDSHTPTPTTSARPITSAPTTPTSTATTPTSTPTTPTSTPTNSPTTTVNPTPTRLPPVTLEAPEDGFCFDCEAAVDLCWSSPYTLQIKEYYRLMMKKGQEPFLSRDLPENHFLLDALSPGHYSWAVAIVRHLTNPSEVMLLSKESKWYSFEIASPTPTIAVRESPTPADLPIARTPIPIYPAPIPRRPPNGYRFEKETTVELGWDWEGQLGDNEHFTVRVYPKGASSSPSRDWVKSTVYRAELYGEPEGEYCWHVMVLWGTGYDNWKALSPRSEEWCFYAIWPSEPSETEPTRNPNKTPPPHD
jgi:hypothetical protein